MTEIYHAVVDCAVLMPYSLCKLWSKENTRIHGSLSCVASTGSLRRNKLGIEHISAHALVYNVEAMLVRLNSFFRDKQEQLVKLANSAEKARQDAIASLQEQTEALRQNHRVIIFNSM